jgi:hypothetical protein
MERLSHKRLTKIACELGDDSLGNLSELVDNGLDLIVISTLDREAFVRTLEAARAITTEALSIIADIPGNHRRVCSNRMIRVKAGD